MIKGGGCWPFSSLLNLFRVLVKSEKIPLMGLNKSLIFVVVVIKMQTFSKAIYSM